ncbi:hypothetical protein [Staphylococcus equorum]|uniref:hypothetical protein n=1 Tax=Staphylococcus equorum TaxID=246432 RepID=UPI0021BF9A26|nr:hypothetical protein [Staphylococcus equorum]
MSVNENTQSKNSKKRERNISKTQKIGFIMPISDVEGYVKGHWEMVKGIFNDIVDEIVIELDIDIECCLVSDTNGTDNIIQRRIVNNIYSSDLIICDVSSKNPNVLFELGMRLAFDKKVIIIKDEKTSYIFDTNNIFHNEYPSDLNYTEIMNFKKDLIKDIKEALDDNNQKSGFLDTFGDFKIATMPKEKSIDEKEAFTKILDEISMLNSNMMSLENNYKRDRMIRDERINSSMQGSNKNLSILKRLTVEILDDYPNKQYFSFNDVTSYLNGKDYRLSELNIKKLCNMLNDKVVKL